MRNLVLLGGGYGNMRILLRLLPNNLPQDVQITLVDRAPYHSLKTEFYALAAGTTPETHMRVTFPTHERLSIVYGEVVNIDRDKKAVFLEDGKEIPYDELVIGLGCEDNFHNVPGAEEHSYSIQTMAKSRKAYDAISALPAGATVGIVGAGLSGIELASELRESRSDLKIKLFDRGPRILKTFPERLSKYVKKWFDKHDVDVIANSNITKVGKAALYNHEDQIDIDLIVWTAGIQPVKVVRDLELEMDCGRVAVNQYHQTPVDTSIYVVGDCAASQFGPSAQLAEEQGEQIVTVLKKVWANESLPEKMPDIKLKGFMGALGKKQGFVYLADRTVTGRIARLMKSGLLWMYKNQNG
ncbi:MAG: NAD(P)/FAD-dependent oxidoreductase [Kurthia gibsonii]|uniref:NAD(P)/FAD-dependent oxidoreductase n=1 Tax=Kurthia gibsonii TaxID=33946 RepID=A0ABU9LKR7_9BACL|nr:MULTISPECIES: NAD(P)/FAD-dependent oxidoreductase [Kurthia]AMA62064.1 pyridine nucleotide-disulfide oxidoreductase family protein [Kurthia sp. 11kri321]MEB6113257.1 NAD(P)/FAD-dependent oxidoreductase [Kurthia gibsonii]MEB7772348.1 NAD(P)/FAD-dependent oxidoreductase [Kurthia gibsonii]RXH52310.1 NAD(P)/FAD-dependent oxidoreductase [Kurthia gibsonii]WIL37921.1 NAD(P)/FAD-dependent oxidoreductase [Kurthia sp. YJT4]